MKTERILKIISLVLGASLTLFSVCYLFIGAKKTQKPHSEPLVLRLWHVETFEGGKGSRSAFLKRVAKNFEKTENALVLVETYTVAGLENAFSVGACPDLLSFARGVPDFLDRALSLPCSFSGGSIGMNTYAYPWCAGQYYLFSETGDFSDVTAENTLLSVSGALTDFSASFFGLRGEFAHEPSTGAYVSFLSGEYKYLLGTQRDICRFETRGRAVKNKPLTDFNDLFQCISVTSEAHAELAFAFVKELLSEQTQSSLGDIGMLSLSDVQAKNILPVFVESDNLLSIREKSALALKSGDTNFLKSCVKALN